MLTLVILLVAATLSMTQSAYEDERTTATRFLLYPQISRMKEMAVSQEEPQDALLITKRCRWKLCGTGRLRYF
ncbi:hypothetical protein Q1695_000105 [Nippostrongylus brasiliensis]|nr:hypothetical protein Q1695_000105 [Nippostrongylus brasiliensis]